jgi:hypothetical protein
MTFWFAVRSSVLADELKTRVATISAMPIDAPVRQTNDQTANHVPRGRMFSMIALSTEKEKKINLQTISAVVSTLHKSTTS